MKSLRKLSSMAPVGVLLCMVQLTMAQTGLVIPPGVPEPGLVIWGSVVNATNAALPVSITSASWSVTDGSKTAVYTASSKPAVRIVTLGTQSFYILEVPFDTRRFGTVTLADPATQGIDSFELKSSAPPTYVLTPTINGVLATVRGIDGAPAGGGTVPVPGFNTAVRGLVRRVDLAILPPADSYESWAASIFGNANLPDAARKADPDGDGYTNENEFAAGTDPKNASSLLRLLTISVTDSQATLGWQSVANKSYVIEAASAVDGPWFSVGTPVNGAGTTTQANVSKDALDDLKFYRLRVLAP